MTNKTKQKPPFWYWIFALMGLVWHSINLNLYLQQAFKTKYLKQMYTDPNILEMIYETPFFVMIAFAINAIFGFSGCVLLFFRKKWAQLFFITSLLGVLLQMSYQIFISESIKYYGPLGLILPITVILISIALLIFAKKGKNNQWIN